MHPVVAGAERTWFIMSGTIIIGLFLIAIQASFENEAVKKHNGTSTVSYRFIVIPVVQFCICMLVYLLFCYMLFQRGRNNDLPSIQDRQGGQNTLRNVKKKLDEKAIWSMTQKEKKKKKKKKKRLSSSHSISEIGDIEEEATLDPRLLEVIDELDSHSDSESEEEVCDMDDLEDRFEAINMSSNRLAFGLLHPLLFSLIIMILSFTTICRTADSLNQVLRISIWCFLAWSLVMLHAIGYIVRPLNESEYSLAEARTTDMANMLCALSRFHSNN